jgi:hypothetical protein
MDMVYTQQDKPKARETRDNSQAILQTIQRWVQIKQR